MTRHTSFNENSSAKFVAEEIKHFENGFCVVILGVFELGTLYD